MDDLTIRTLLSRFVRQLLVHTPEPLPDRDELAERIAVQAWNSLVYLLRQSFVQSDRLHLAEVGEFVKNDNGSWSFYPAVSIVEADSVILPQVDAIDRMAALALFHLKQGADFAKALPYNVPTRTEQTPEEKLLQSIFGQKATSDDFSDDLRKFAFRLERIAQRLEKEQTTSATGRETLKVYPAPEPVGPPEPIRLPVEDEIYDATTTAAESEIDFGFVEPPTATESE